MQVKPRSLLCPVHEARTHEVDIALIGQLAPRLDEAPGVGRASHHGAATERLRYLVDDDAINKEEIADESRPYP